jgi:type II secretory pathway pseudopilin PulG
MKCCTRNRAFTLVELAIILVVVGLLAGGILQGQAMYRQQQLRNVLSEAKNFSVAMRQFQEKYAYLPGDFPTATEIWGRADGGLPLTANCSPINVASVGDATCNGDGNGIIENNNGAGAGESLRFWQHLSAAKLIAGAYSGVAVAGNIHASQAGVNVPASALANGAFSIYSWGPLVGASFFSGLFGTRLPGRGCVYAAQNLKFRRPVYIGDTVTATITVLAVDVAKKRISFSTICAVDGKEVIIGDAEIFIP